MKIVNENLTNTRNTLNNEIALLSHEQFNHKPEQDEWSIAQVCHHLFLVEMATIKAVAWGLKEVEHKQVEQKDIHLLLLDRKKKFKAPPIVEPDTEPFQVLDMIDLLNNSREKLIDFLGTIEDKLVLDKKSVKHPALGEISLYQWIEQIFLHEQRHIEQIKEIKTQNNH